MNTTSLSIGTETAKKSKSKYQLLSFAIYPILIPLLYFALRNAPLLEIWNVLHRLKLWQIAALLTINISMYLLVTLRWWVIAHAGNKTIPYFPLVLVRVAVFGVSYFTLGPQVGGEPLQVYYLQRKYGMTYTRATATVIMDKLLEFLANFFLLVVGLTAIVQAGIFSTNAGKPLVESDCDDGGFVVALPPYHIDGSRHLSHRCRVTPRPLQVRKTKMDPIRHRLRTSGRFVLPAKPNCALDGSRCIPRGRGGHDR